MTSIRGKIAVLFLLLLYWENGSAQSFSYYYRPGPGSEGSFNLGSPQQQSFTGFSPQPPFSGGTPPPGAQFYQYTLPGGNDVPTQPPRVLHQPIQYYQPQQQQQQQQQQQPIHQQFVQPQPQQFIPQPQAQQQPLQYVQPQRVEVGSQQHQSPQTQPSQAPRVIQQIDNGVSQVPYEIRQFYVGQQPTYAPVIQNNIGNANRAEAINNPKGTVDVKESSEKITLESQSNNDTVTQPRIRFPAQTVTLSVTHTKVREVETSEESSEEEEPTPAAPVRTLPRVTSTAAAVTTRSTTAPTTIRTTTPEEIKVTTEQTRATVNEDQFVKPSPSSETPDTRSPFLQSVFPNGNVGNEEGSPFLPNQFSPQTQQFLPSRFTTRDPQSQFLPNQFPPSGFAPHQFGPQNQYQGFPHQFPNQHHQFTSPEQYFQNQFPSADPPRPVHVNGGNRQEESFTFRPFPSEIPEIENNSGEIEDEPQPFVSSTIPSDPSPSPVPVTTTTTSTARTSSGRNGKSYYKFATPAGLYDTGTAVPLQQYSVTGSGDQPEEPQSPPAVRKGRKRIRVNRNRFRQRPAIEQPQQIQPVIPQVDYQPIVSQAPVFINSVTPSPEEDVTTYRSKFRYVPRTGSATTRRPEPVDDTNHNEQNSNTNTNTDESAQDAINRRLQTLQRQIRFKTSNKNQDRKSG